MKLDELTFASWRNMRSEQRIEVLQRVADRVQGHVANPNSIILDGHPFVFVPGGSAQIGWDGRLALTEAQREHWGRFADSSETFEELCEVFFGARRLVNVSPLLVEKQPRSIDEYLDDVYCDDVENALRAAVAMGQYALLTNDEWEYVARAEREGLFPWGNLWPSGVPYGSETSFIGHLEPAAEDAITLITDPYQLEVVLESDWLRGGDGGTAVCGGRPPPEAWYSFAFPFQYPRSFFEECLPETYEAVLVRRVVRLMGTL